MISPFKVSEPFLEKRLFAVMRKINSSLPNIELSATEVQKFCLSLEEGSLYIVKYTCFKTFLGADSKDNRISQLNALR